MAEIDDGIGTDTGDGLMIDVDPEFGCLDPWSKRVRCVLLSILIA